MSNGFFYWYGPDVSMDDTEITKQQFEDYMNTGVYYDEEKYNTSIHVSGVFRTSKSRTLGERSPAFVVWKDRFQGTLSFGLRTTGCRPRDGWDESCGRHGATQA